MDGLTVTMGVVGAFAGAASGAVVAAAGKVAAGGASLMLSLAFRERVEIKSSSAKRYIAGGALVGALALGSVPSIYNYFTGAVEQKPVTLSDCVESAPNGATGVQLVDGRCSYGTATP